MTDATGAYSIAVANGRFIVKLRQSNDIQYKVIASNVVMVDSFNNKDLNFVIVSQKDLEYADPDIFDDLIQIKAEAVAQRDQAKISETKAKTSEINAKNSETASKISETNSKNSENATKLAETNAKSSETKAKTSETNAKNSETAAKTSETNSKQSEVSASSSATSALASAVRAENAATTVIGSLVDAGPYNAQTGVLPTPVMSGSTKLSSIWKVTGNGTAGGIDLGIGDSLIFTSRDNTYYKIDNTESVSKVNNKTGVVVLNAEDVGAEPQGLIQSSQLPMPDVWAPLNDSLNLILGYGTDVQRVGVDTLKMPGTNLVNFSRSTTATYIGKDGQLKTAAANEPRFEKEGLLIEGLSTNLFPWSQQFVGKWGRVNGIASADPVFPNAVSLDNLVNGYVSTSVGSLSVGTAHTITAIVTGYVDGVTELSAYFSSQWQGSYKVIGKFGQYTIVSFTWVVTDNPNTAVTGLGWVAGKVSGVVLCAMQIESLPFASSYIPTAGAAVTRAADMATLPQSLNLGESQLGFSLAVEFDSVNPGSYRVISLSDYSGVQGDGSTVYIRHAGRETGPFPAPLGKRHRIAYTLDYSGAITVCINSKQMTATSWDAGTATSPEKITLGNRWDGANNMALEGHLRDLKIWTKAPLTVEQLKGASA